MVATGWENQKPFRQNNGTIVTKRSSTTSSLLTCHVQKTLQLNTCHRLTSDRRNGYTSCATTNSQSTTLRSICHPKPRSKTRTKRTLYLMTTLPPQSSTKPSMPYWTRFTKATTRRVNSFERSRRSDHADQITPINTGRHDEMTFTRFTSRHHGTVVNQICPMGVCK